MPHTLARFVLVAVALVAFTASAVPITLSGTVTDVATGQPVGSFPVGATRVDALGTGGPNDPIPVEISGNTDSFGNFTYTVDSAIPGLAQVLIFTRGISYNNEIYNGAPCAGQTPTYAEVAHGSVVAVDMRAGASGINFVLEAKLIPGKTTHMLPMTDGTHVATDVYLPSGTGPWPVLLYRTPYGKNGDHPGEEWLSYGYAIVAQDCRGTFDSEGLFRMFMDDGWGANKDGFETMAWIRSQSWCNGQVCTAGGSARGITQNMLAGSVPAGLVCQHISVAASDLYTQAIFHDGAFRKRLVEGWMEGRGAAAYQYMMDLITEHPMYTDALWGDGNLEPRYPMVNWPIVHVGGWYDIFQRGTINNFVNLQHHGGPNALGKQKLVIGPYGHGDGDGGFDWSTGSYPAYYAHERNWFDYWVKGINTHVMDQPPVCYWALGAVDEPNAPGNEWRFADDWPVPSTAVEYYLHDGGLLSIDAPAAPDSSQSYVFNPTNPVPTLGGANLSGSTGPYDQRPVESRPDVLVFTTPVLEQYVEVTGQITVRLWASSSAVDTDFTAKLCDVYPDGRSMLVCDGIVRARHRNTDRDEEFLVPGAIYEFEIDLWETCLAFNAGHRIRVDISSSNYDRYDVNPNTGEPWNQHTHLVSATNTIYHDAAHPSHIVLPVTSEVPDPNQNLPAGSPVGLAWLFMVLVCLAMAICLKGLRKGILKG